MVLCPAPTSRNSRSNGEPEVVFLPGGNDTSEYCLTGCRGIFGPWEEDGLGEIGDSFA
jgi:hypothetical protein